jgi:PLP dependent protein
MAVNIEAYRQIKSTLDAANVCLVAVSKTKPVSDIMDLYQQGQRHFGENYVQELVDKQPQLPTDVHWHFIGHLQSNKVKYIASFVHLIHGVDSLNLLKEINKQAAKHSRVIDVLLQIHIAEEETKFGLSQAELQEILSYYTSNPSLNLRIRGLMGMASFSTDQDKLRKEFHSLSVLMEETKVAIASAGLPGQEVDILSMGMSSDYELAIKEGSTMVRIGSLLFGSRL